MDLLLNALPLPFPVKGLTTKLVVFRDSLPGVNVSLLVSRWPYLVIDFDAASLNERLNVMR